MEKGDVYRHWEGLFYKILDVRKIGSDTRVYFESKFGTKNNMTKKQFETPVKGDGGNIQRFKLANDDPENPWRT